jgi:MFS family permease
MFARVVAPEHRGSIFGVNYALQNLGFGIGATVSGLVLDPARPYTFQYLFLADAVSFLIFAALLLFAGELRPAFQESQDHKPDQTTLAGVQGYGLVLRDRGLLACAALNTLLSAASFSQLNSAFPAWATGEVHATSRLIGFAFLANTVTITVAQLFVMRYLLRGRRRTRAVASAALLFGAAWLIVLAAGKIVGGAFAGAALIASLVVFALGETILSPSLPALVNDLAPDSLRGRYNAVYSLSWQIGPIIGPIVAGLTLARGLGVLHFAGLAVACGLASLFAIAIERVIPLGVNRGHHMEVHFEHDSPGFSGADKEGGDDQ